MGGIIVATALSIFAFGSDAPAQAHASIPPEELAAAVKAYQIPAGSIAVALNRLAEANGVQMVYRAKLTRGVETRGLSGTYAIDEALHRLLAGTGLGYRLTENGRSVLIVLAQNDAGTQSDAGAIPLPPVDVAGSASAGTGGGDPTGTGPGESGGRFTGYNAVDAVAATKTETPILQTPVAIQVVPRETMDDQQDITVQDALIGNVSGVVLGTYPDRADFNIRGFDTGANPIYYNGLRIENALAFETSNLQSLEVLKGPASILFGRIEPGGLIWAQSKLPQATPYYSFETQAGGFGTTRTTIDFTGPLTEDKTLLYRLNADFSQSNLFTDFLYNKNVFISPSISYQPIEQFKLYVEANYTHVTQTTNYGNNIVLPGGTAPAPGVPITRYLGDPTFIQADPDQQKDGFVYYNWTFKINPDWSLTNRGMYQAQWEGYSSSQFYAGPTPTSVSTTDYWDPYNSYTIAGNVDLNGKFATGPLQHSVLLGTDLFNNDSPPSITGYLSSINVDIYNPQYFPSPFYFSNPNAGYYFFQSYEHWRGAYAQDLISTWNDSVHLLIGGRYDWDNQGFGIGGTASQAEAANTPTLDKAFSPRIGLVLQPAPWLSFYANYTTGFAASNNVNYLNMPLPPQKSYQWEGGAKAEFFDKRLSATMAFYDITKSNIPTTDPNNPLNTILIGLARSEGVEFDITGKINDNWSLIGNYTHEDVRAVVGTPNNDPATEIYTENPVAGNWLPSAPANFGNIWVKYTADGALTGLNVGGGLNVVGSQFGDNANSFKLPQYTLVNGMISYRFPWQGAKITAQLNVKNLFDTAFYQSSQTRYYIIAGAPRAILASLRLEF